MSPCFLLTKSRDMGREAETVEWSPGEEVREGGAEQWEYVGRGGGVSWEGGGGRRHGEKEGEEQRDMEKERESEGEGGWSCRKGR